MPASAVPYGPVMSVNSATYGTQTGARTAALADGGYVVVWVNQDAQGEGQAPAENNAASDIRMRLFNANGSARGEEIAVGQATAGWQVDPQVAVTADGRIAVSWTDGWGFWGGAEHPGSGSGGDGSSSQAVRLRLFSGGGQALGGEQLVNQETRNNQLASKLVALEDGRVLVAWEDWSMSCNSLGCGGGPGAKARLYASSGQALGSEIAWTGDWNYGPTPVALAGGGWTALWLSAYYMDPAQLRLRVFDPAGGALQTEYAWATGGGAGAQWSTAALTGGAMVLAWTQRDAAIGDGAGKGIDVQVVKADGTLQGKAFIANTTTGADQENARVAALADGGFVVVWESMTVPDTAGNWTRELRAQVFDAQGTRRGSELLVQGDDASVGLNDVVGLEGGGFAVAWTGRSWIDVHVRAYGASGQPLGDAVVVHGAGGYQNQARLVALADGAFSVTWVTASDGYNGGDGNGEGVQTRSFLTKGLSFTGSAAADRIEDTPLGDRIDAGAGNDRIHCSGGADVVAGGPGVDTLVLDASLAEVLQHLQGWRFGAGGPTAGETASGTLTLSGIERVRLSDAWVAFDTAAGGKTWQAAALYRAGFGSMPSSTDLARWTAVADTAADSTALASALLRHYVPGGIGNEALVAHLYRTLTGLNADAATVAQLAASIGPGGTWASQAALYAWAAELPLNTDAMTAGPGVPFVGSVQLLDAAYFGG